MSKPVEENKLVFQPNTLKYILLIALILLLPWSMPTFFINLINSYIEPVLSQIPSSIINDIIFVIIIILIGHETYQKLRKGYILSYKLLVFFSIISIWYSILRITQSTWKYTTLHFLEQLAYADIIFIFLLSLLVLILFKKKNKPSEKSKSAGFVIDSPTTNDMFGRKKLAKTIVKRIMSTELHLQSFAIGITGEWGSGKTTFLEIIEDELKALDNAEKDLIIIHFNPWQFDSATTLIDDFFNTLRISLKDYNSELSAQLTNYVEQLTSIESNIFTKISKFGLDSLSKEKSLDELFEDINDTLEKIQKTIVIFIDDLDRLDKGEIIEIIRLIRNTANFRNIVFIVAYNTDYILSAIKDLNSYNFNKYLEKIFQVEINLPKAQTELKRDLIVDCFKDYCTENVSNDIDKYFGINVPKEKILLFGGFEPINYIASIREANRLINSFLLIYDQLKNEVEFSDLLSIEILKMKYPKVYLNIEQKKDKWLITESNNSSRIYNNFQLRKRSSDYANEPSSMQKTVLEYDLRENLEYYEIKESDTDNIVSLFHALFFKGYPPKLSIAYPNNFYKYFSYRIYNESLSEIDFSRARINLGNREFRDKISQWLKQGYAHELLRKLERFTSKDDFNDIRDFENLFAGFLIIQRTSKTSTHFNILNFLSLGKELYEIEEVFESFIETELLKALPPFTCESRILFSALLIQKEESRLTPIPVNKCKDILLKYLYLLLDSGSTYIINMWAIYDNIFQAEKDIESPIIQKAKTIMINSIKKNPIEVFRLIVRSPTLPNENWKNEAKYSIDKDSIIYRIFNQKHLQNKDEKKEVLLKLIDIYEHHHLYQNDTLESNKIKEATTFFLSFITNGLKYTEFSFKYFTPVIIEHTIKLK